MFLVTHFLPRIARPLSAFFFFKDQVQKKLESLQRCQSLEEVCSQCVSLVQETRSQKRGAHKFSSFYVFFLFFRFSEINTLRDSICFSTISILCFTFNC